jgi:triacylglycerol lipase
LEAPPRTAADSRWWRRWWPKGAPGDQPPAAVLETHVSGCVLRAPVALQTDGRFEGLFEVQLPPARRGWRLARNRLTVGTATAEGCGIVVAPPTDAPAAVVVILPLASTSGPDGPQALTRSEPACRLTAVMQRRQREAHGRLPIYYLAAATDGPDNRVVELALAATALGWPSGCFVLLPGGEEAGLALGLDRLRWLFAGDLELQVLNLEPAAGRLLADECLITEDRAIVRDFTNLDGGPAAIGYGRSANLPQPAAAPLRPTRSARISRYPIVFCHGLLAFTTLRLQLPEDLNYFSPLRKFLGQRGFRVLYPQVGPTAGVAQRARQLRDQILRWTNEPVNIIAHSMGGLDARYLITHLGMADRVRTLTTVSTPHRGTALADWFTTTFRQRIPLLLAMQALGINVDGFRDLRPAVCQEFNRNTPNVQGVQYLSYGGEATSSRLSPLLRRMWAILTPIEGPNDGLVSVASARWGEYLGTLHADHFAQTPDAVYLRPGEDFDSLGFFTRLVEELARRGF